MYTSNRLTVRLEAKGSKLCFGLLLFLENCIMLQTKSSKYKSFVVSLWIVIEQGDNIIYIFCGKDTKLL